MSLPLWLMLAVLAIQAAATIVGVVTFRRVMNLISSAKGILATAAKHGDITDRTKEYMQATLNDLRQATETEVRTATALATQAKAQVEIMEQDVKQIKNVVTQANQPRMVGAMS